MSATIATTATSTRVRRMIVNLKPGDRIRISRFELPISITQNIIETEVLAVRRSEDRCYRVLTSYGELLPHQPTDKYELVS